MKAEKDGGMQLSIEKYQIAKKKALEAECRMQNRMGEFIKEKLALQNQIRELEVELCSLEEEGRDSKKDL